VKLKVLAFVNGEFISLRKMQIKRIEASYKRVCNPYKNLKDPKSHKARGIVGHGRDIPWMIFI
jgi:hypothetical protein